MNLKQNEISLRGISIGGLIGATLVALSTILVFKLGMSVPVMSTTPLLGYLLLKASGKYTQKDNLIIVAISVGSVFGFFSMEAVLGAIFLFRQEAFLALSLSFQKLSLFTAVAIGSGIAFALLFEKGIFAESLPFPYQNITVKLVESVTGTGKRESRIAFVSTLGSGLLTLLAKLYPRYLSGIGHNLAPSILPRFIGLNFTPILFGMGIFLGTTIARSIGVGAVFSMAVWGFSENFSPTVSFSSHLLNPWNISLAIGLMVVPAFIPVFSALPVASKTFSGRREQGSSFRPSHGALRVSIGILLILMLLLTTGFFMPVSLPAWKSLIIILVTGGCALILSRAVAEAGLVSASSLVYLSIVIFAFLGFSFSENLLFAGFTAVASFSSAYFIGTLKLAELANFKKYHFAGYHIGGALLGAFIGAFVTFLLINKLETAPASFPMPASISWGGVAKGLVDRSLPAFMNPWLIIAGGALSWIVKRFGLSPVGIGIGLLLAPADSLVVVIGAELSQRIYKNKNRTEQESSKKKLQYLATGLMTGESIIILSAALLKLF